MKPAGRCLTPACSQEEPFHLPRGSTGSTPQAQAGSQNRRHAAAGPTSGFETPEGQGWKWLVLALALYIAADKSGNLPGQFMGAEADYGAAPVGAGSFDFFTLPSTEWISPFSEPRSSGRKLASSGGSSSSSSSSSSGSSSSSTGSTGSTGISRRTSSASSASSSGSSSAGSDSHASHQSHPHEAMFFLVGSIIVSTMVMHISMKVKGIQQTVVLFVLGVLLSLLVQGLHLEDKLGPAGRSYTMWMTIDPHLLLFTLLPPLLAGDAMGIDTSVVRKVANQCLFLAGPGVALNAGIVALFLYAYLNAVGYSWEPLLCLTTGAILCATDPVAVVALLKELGASPTLTVQIQGESLLNDGTAIVLYTVSYNMLKGEDYDHGDVIVFLVKTALYAWILGMIIGGLFFLWIRGAKNKLNHDSSLIQVSLTIACAYLSFIVAEGLFHISGVLSTVAASLVLAHKMWPEVVSHETMHTIWHVFEYLGNTIIFFLAGSLTGSIMVRIPVVDFVHLFVIYIVLVLVRSSLILCSRPLLRLLHAERKEVPLPDALVMSWGGLRGAVGLALAIQVSIDKAGGTLSQESADKVLFYVGGVALLTLAINATTCPMLVKHLGITQTPEVKLKLMMMLHHQLQDLVTTSEHPPQVVHAVQAMLDDMQHHLSLHRHSGAVANSGDVLKKHSDGSERLSLQFPSAVQRVSTRVSFVQASGSSTSSLIGEFECARRRYDDIPALVRTRLEKMVGESPVEDQLDEMVALLYEEEVDVKLVRAINEAFLNLVRSEYWHRIEHGEMSSVEAEPLLMSITNALSAPSLDLHDFQFIIPHAQWQEEKDKASPQELQLNPAKSLACLSVCWEESVEPYSRSSTTKGGAEQENQEPCTRAIIDSMAFNTLIMLTIIANSVVVFVEDALKNTDSADSPAWTVFEILFTVIFTIEFIIKLVDHAHRYFCDAWNVFDFSLVVVGIVTIILEFTHNGAGNNSETQIARSIKVLKILRAMRLVRLIRVMQVISARIAGNESQLEVAEHMHKFDILYQFICARMSAQKLMLKYFGRGGKANSPELARCIVQSQIAIYTAMVACLKEEDSLDPWMVEEAHVCHMSIQVTSELEHFIVSARKGGVLTTTEAESLMHSLHEHIKELEQRIMELRSGKADAPLFIASADTKAFSQPAPPEELPAAAAEADAPGSDPAPAPEDPADVGDVVLEAPPPAESHVEEPAASEPMPAPDLGAAAEQEASRQGGTTHSLATDATTEEGESIGKPEEVEAGGASEAFASGLPKKKKAAKIKTKAKKPAFVDSTADASKG